MTYSLEHRCRAVLARLNHSHVIPVASVDDDVVAELSRRGLALCPNSTQLAALPGALPYLLAPSTFVVSQPDPKPATLADFEIGSTIEVFEPDGCSRGEFVVGRIADNGARFDARVLVKDGQVYSGVHLGRVLVPSRGLCFASDGEPKQDACEPLGADCGVRS